MRGYQDTTADKAIYNADKYVWIDEACASKKSIRIKNFAT